MSDYNNLPDPEIPASDDKFKRLQIKIDETTDIARDNIQRALARGETIDTLAEGSQDLSQHANQFYRNSAEYRRKMRCQRIKWFLLLLAVIVIISLIIYGATRS